MDKNTRTILIRLSIWGGMAIITFLLMLSILPLQYAFLRVVGIMIIIAFIHYTNRSLARRYMLRGMWQAYVWRVLVLVLFIACLRVLLENFVFPPETQPAYFRQNPARFLFFTVSAGMMFFVSSVVLYVNHLATKEKELLQTINAQNEARLQNLHSQINPHFLFNALNNIYSLVLTGSKQAPEMLLHLTELLRYSVYQRQLDMVSVSDEARQIEFLIELFCLRRDEQYNISFTKKIENGAIEPMILIPLAENCLKHCDFDLNPQAYAKMNLQCDKNLLIFETENTFNDLQQKNKTGGVGLKNIHERLQLIYGDSFKFSTSQQENIYKVQLRIEWKQ